MNYRIFRIFSILMLIVLLVSACAPKPAEEAAEPAAEEAGQKIKVALILPGRKDDVSWNQAAFDGINQAVKEAKVQVELTVVEQVYDPVDIEPALRDYAKQGYNLVIGHGFQFQEPIIKVATEFPDVNFAIGTGYKLAENVGVYDVKLEQGGYLMGLIAGSLTESNLVGAVGGVDVSEIHRGHVAFLLGAQKVNPEVKVLNTFVGDFNDLAGAKEAALSQINAGADLLWQSGDGVGIAVLGACQEQNTNCMGNVVDQKSLAPNNVIASFVYHWSSVYTQMINETADNTFGNKKYWVELANDGVSVEYNDALKSLVTPELQAALDEAIAGFKANTLDLGDMDNFKLETTE
ncbi:MAG: BMP family protein [Anaerolineales bacterium]|jgi:basic membrane protein A|nr:BMP family protein [Anaerolineales bacterium]